MEESKLQRLHDTLKKLAPKGNHGGLGSASLVKGGCKHRDNGLPKNGLYSYFVKPGHFKKTFADSDEEEDGAVSKDKTELKKEKKMKRRQEKETKKAEKRAKKAEKRAIKEREKAEKASSKDQDGVGENVRCIEGEANGGVASADAEPNGGVASMKRDLSSENGVGGTGLEEHYVTKRKKSKGLGGMAASDGGVEEGKDGGKKASKKRDGEAGVVSKAKKGKKGKGIEVKSKRKNCAGESTRASDEAEDNCVEEDAEGMDPAKRVKSKEKRKKKKSNVSLPSPPSDRNSLTMVDSRKRSCGSENSKPTSCDGGEDPGITPRKSKLKKKAVNGSALACNFGDTEGGGRKKSSKRCKGEGQDRSAEDDSEAKAVSKKMCEKSSKRNKTKISNKVEFEDEEACSNGRKRSEAAVTASVDGTGDVQRQKKSKKMKVEAQGGVLGDGGSEQKRCGSLGGGEEGARRRREPVVGEPITSAEQKVKKAKKAGGKKARGLENGGGDATARREGKKKKRKTT